MAFEAYLYIDGVRGDSTSEIGLSPDKRVAKSAGGGPIEIKSYGLSLEMPLVENRSATGAVTVGRANFAEFETAKSLDVSTGALLFYCLSGKHIKQAVVAVYRATDEGGDGKPTLYMQAIYNNIVITEVGVSGGGDEMPSETLKFNYGNVKLVYYKTSPTTGKSEGLAEFHWDRVANTGEKSG